MHRLVDPPVVQVIAEGRGQLARQRNLRRLVERAAQRGRVLAHQNRVAQGHQPRAHRVEHRARSRRRRTGLIIVQQRVIGIAVAGQALASSRRRPTTSCSVGRKAATSRRRAPRPRCPAPARWSCASSAASRAGTFGGALIAAPDMAQVRGGHVIGGLAVASQSPMRGSVRRACRTPSIAPSPRPRCGGAPGIMVS